MTFVTHWDGRDDRANHRLVDRLVERFAFFKPMLEEHLADNFGEVLPHVLMGEVTGELVRVSLEAPHVCDLQEILDVLEEEYQAGDTDVRELLSVSFLENLPRAPQPGHGLSRRLGPGLAGELTRMAGG
jgi:hypothetical protein